MGIACAAASVTICQSTTCHNKPHLHVPQMPEPPRKLNQGTSNWHNARKLGYVDEIPEELVRALQHGRCVAMVGAGLSYPANLPGYEALLKMVATTAGVPLELPSNGTYDDLDKVQFQLADHIGKDKMCNILRSKLYLTEPCPDAMQVVLNAFCKLPFAAVVSWNWDNILDAKYTLVPNNASGFQSVLRSMATPQNYENLCTPLLKMQGDLTNATTVVLTKNDYENRAHEADTFLRSLHETYTVLHIGMSLRPGGVGERRRPGSRHYAILNDVTPAHRRELERWNIHAISYDSKATIWKGNQIIMQELARRAYQLQS